MRIHLTLDYELFFGHRTGTPQACMIDASEPLLRVLEEFSAPAVFFVDASYLVRLQDYCHRSPCLAQDYALVAAHIRHLEASGHQIQLHVHPHWFDSWHDGNRWQMVTDRYRLAQWSPTEIFDILTRCTTELNAHLSQKAFAFRAGGWCVQPFSVMANALQANGITVDSSVFHGGITKSEAHQFDFRDAPPLGQWHFSTNPCRPEATGRFSELPITSLRVSPLFYWRLALTRLFGQGHDHRRFGDGSPVDNGYRHLLRLLTQPSHMAVSIDGFKAMLLRRAFHHALRDRRTHFVAIGHPKSLTPYALEHLRAWLDDIYGGGRELEGYPQPEAIPVNREATTA